MNQITAPYLGGKIRDILINSFYDDTKYDVIQWEEYPEEFQNHFNEEFGHSGKLFIAKNEPVSLGNAIKKGQMTLEEYIKVTNLQKELRKTFLDIIEIKAGTSIPIPLNKQTFFSDPLNITHIEINYGDPDIVLFTKKLGSDYKIIIENIIEEEFFKELCEKLHLFKDLKVLMITSCSSITIDNFPESLEEIYIGHEYVNNEFFENPNIRVMMSRCCHGRHMDKYFEVSSIEESASVKHSKSEGCKYCEEEED